MLGVIAGLALILAPESLLEPIVAARWELDLIRFIGVVAIAVWLLWPWAITQGGRLALRMRVLVGATTTTLVLYLVLSHPLFLILTFVIPLGAALNIGMERADLAVQALQRRLGLSRRRH